MKMSLSYNVWVILTIMLCTLDGTAHAAEHSHPDCTTPGENDSALVIGKSGERLYIHPIHPQQCQSPNVGECAPKAYVIPGDSVTVRETCGDWSLVVYINKKQKQTVGWVNKNLLSMSNVVNEQPPSIPNADITACQTVADHANHGTLNQLKVKEQENLITKEEANNIFGDEQLGGLSLWFQDLDNDQIAEYVAITTQGTARVDSLLVRSKKKGSEVQALPDNGDGSIDITFLKIGERYYFLTGDNGYGDISMASLWRYNSESGFSSVCAFKKRKQPITELVKGKETLVCLAAAADTVKHLDYPLIHAIGELKDKERFGSKSPLEGMAKVDINNDGRLENVVQIDFTHGGGRGCGGTYLAVADDTRTNIPKNKLNDLLLETLGGYSCGTNMKIFIHGGVSYIDTYSGVSDRTIYRINGDQAEAICQFQGRWFHIVAGSPEDTE